MAKTSMQIESAKLSARERRAANQQRRFQRGIEKVTTANNRSRAGSPISKHSNSSQRSQFLRQALENQTRIAGESQQAGMKWSPPQSEGQKDGNGMRDSYAAQPPKNSFYPPSNSTFSSSSAPLGTPPSSSQSSPIRNRRQVVSHLAFLASRQLPRPTGPTWKRQPGQGLQNYALVQPSDPLLYAYSSRSAKIEDGTVDMIDAPWRN